MAFKAATSSSPCLLAFVASLCCLLYLYYCVFIVFIRGSSSLHSSIIISSKMLSAAWPSRWPMLFAICSVYFSLWLLLFCYFVVCAIASSRYLNVLLFVRHFLPTISFCARVTLFKFALYFIATARPDAVHILPEIALPLRYHNFLLCILLLFIIIT